MPPDDPLKEFLGRSSRSMFVDRPGFRIYLVRVGIRKKAMSIAAEVEEAYASRPDIQAKAARDGFDFEQTLEAIAIDSVRIQLEAAGFTRGELEQARLLGVQRVTAAEVLKLSEEFAKKEGS